MTLTSLVDNNSIIDRYYLAEPGFSCLLEDDDARVLFDSGYSSVFLDNADAMGLDLASVDAVVVSHGHDDHTGGLRRWAERLAAGGSAPRRPSLIAHPLAFHPKRHDGISIGSPAPLEVLAEWFEPRLSRTPIPIGGRFVFLGEIPRANAVEGLEPLGEAGGPDGSVPDGLLDDSALVWKGDEGLVIVTGCSHAGIANIVEYAMRACGDDRVADIVGGFHLLGASAERLDFTAERLRACSPRAIHPCHCTDLAAKIRLAASLPVQDYGVGLRLEYS